MRITIGLDVGTVSVKAACLVAGAGACPEWQGVAPLRSLGELSSLSLYISPYRRILGSPLDGATELLGELAGALPKEAELQVALTGSAGKLVAGELGLPHYSEFRAVAAGVHALHPETCAIFEMGGESSRFLRIESRVNGDERREVGVVDYDTNGDCAAGTGSFMDQQASRLLYDIEQVGELVASSEKGANIAGRCSVFAKSDMIHAQQKGATPPQVLRGLCEAVARNFKSSVVKGRRLSGKIAFVGGVANNAGVVSALSTLFDEEGEGLFVPEEPAFCTALGAALLEHAQSGVGPAVEVGKARSALESWPPLHMEGVRHLGRERGNGDVGELPVKKGSDAYLGVDIGSVSTNLVLIDAKGRLLHEIYLKTQARPIQMVGEGLAEIAGLFGSIVRVRGVGTTGSGRELIGELIGADTINDEITAHKTGAARVAGEYLDCQVDTILEIGGQDAKFISLNEGVVVDFTMNEACAAGTGSFLEEQSEKMGVSIVGEFARRAISSRAPMRLGERCTVFMEQDVTACLRNGAAKDDVIGGLAYSIVQNYLNRVVRGRPIGDTVFFQGGTAYNDSVAAAFSIVLGKEIIVPPHNGVMGAFGAALLAREKMEALGQASAFRGFDIGKVRYEVREFGCRACSNRCDIQEFSVEGHKTYWGDKCSERYRKKAKVEREPVVEDLQAFRADALERNWVEEFRGGVHGEELAALAAQLPRRGVNGNGANNGLGRFGMLRAMYFYQRHPFWRAYLEALGGEVVLSPVTTGRLADEALEASVAEPCFPIQVAHGHLLELGRDEVDTIVIPCQINELSCDTSVQSHLCPWGQTLAYVLGHSPAASGLEDKLLFPIVHFRQGERFVERELWGYFSRFGVGRSHHRLAVRLGYAAQSAFQNALLEKGGEALASLEESSQNGVVLVGRPYNLYDPGLNLNLTSKLRKFYGSNVIPLDFLYTDAEELAALNPNMYWNYGQKILRTALWTRKRSSLHLIHVTNFKCGPDSFIKSFAAEGAGKPLLTLQFDAHSNDAGMMTRCEAYLDSKGLLRWWQ